jgi:thiol-disulfide isomerase/thioredoxin
MLKDKTSRSKFRLKRVLVLLSFLILISGIYIWQLRSMNSNVAPPLQGVLLSGKPYALPAKPGEPVLVNFWATWCQPCLAEQGSIAAIAQDHPNTITVVMRSGKDAGVASYIAEKNLHFAVLNDADGHISSSWGVRAVPASFVIGPEGQIRSAEVGYQSEFELRFRLWLAGLMG